MTGPAADSDKRDWSDDMESYWSFYGEVGQLSWSNIRSQDEIYSADQRVYFSNLHPDFFTVLVYILKLCVTVP